MGPEYFIKLERFFNYYSIVDIRSYHVMNNHVWRSPYCLLCRISPFCTPLPTFSLVLPLPYSRRHLLSICPSPFCFDFRFPPSNSTYLFHKTNGPKDRTMEEQATSDG